jgi:hypothetical protein
MRANAVSRVSEELTTVRNRSGQLVHDLTELGSEIASLETAAAALTEGARVFAPPRQRDGYVFIDPSVDTSDPRETLAILKQGLLRTAENLEHAKQLLEARCETIRAIVG